MYCDLGMNVYCYSYTLITEISDGLHAQLKTSIVMHNYNFSDHTSNKCRFGT